jgi:hypothetical protein
MEWFANVIGDESDEAFEDAIIEITERIKNDKSLTEWQKNNDFPSDDSILNYFNTEEIEGYNKVVTLCDTTTILVVSDLNNHEINCNELFNDILEYNYTKKISEELTLVDDPTTDSYYILKLDLSPIDTNYLNICYIEFYKEYILNFIGIPEIITSYKNVLMPNLVNYSFSCYNENILQYKFGHYNYPNELSSFRYKDEEYVKTKIFKHLTKLFDGDKTIIVTVEKHPFFEIDGQNILCTLPITPFEAALGAEITVPAIEGNVTVKIPPMTSSGQKLRLSGQGIENKTKSKKGDMIITISIKMPDKLSDEEKELYTKLKELSSFDIRKDMKNDK